MLCFIRLVLNLNQYAIILYSMIQPSPQASDEEEPVIRPAQPSPVRAAVTMTCEYIYIYIVLMSRMCIILHVYMCVGVYACAHRSYYI